jgi:hypothetical protein
MKTTSIRRKIDSA